MNQTLDPENYEGGDLEALADLDRYYGWIIDEFRPFLRGEAVEIGAGIGAVSKRLIDLVDRLDLVEPSPNLHPHLNAAFGDRPGVEIHRETIESWTAKRPSDSADSIVMVNVLEHIEDDARALAELHRILRPGGYLLIMVPAMGFLFSRLDRIHGHFRRYEKQPLRDRTAAAGFTVEKIKYMDLTGVFPWWLLNVKLGATTFNPKMVGIYDRYFVPVTRAVESVVTPPLGKNLVMAARKPLGE